MALRQPIYALPGLCTCLISTILSFKKHKIRLFPNVLLLGFVISIILISSSDIKVETFQGVVFDTSQNYFLFQSKWHHRYYIPLEDHPYNNGDFLTVKGKAEKVHFSTLESSFDFNEYLSKKGITYQINIKSIKVNYSNFVKANTIKKNFLSHFSETSKSLVSGLLFGENLGGETLDSLSDMHLYKIIFGSGFYLSLFFSIFVKLFTFKGRDKIPRVIAIVLLTFLNIFTFPKFASLRVLSLFVLRWINDYLLKKKFSYLELLSISGLFFLFFDPFLASQDAFVLGYGFSVFIYLIRPLLRRFKGIKKKFIFLLLTYLFFLPFEISYYHSTLINANFIHLLLLPFFIPLAVLSLFSFFHVPLYSLINHYSAFVSSLVKLFHPIRLEIYLRPLTNLEIVIYYFILLAFIYYFTRYFKPIHRFLSSLIVVSLSFNAFPIINLLKEEVSFINVGQGDACLIKKSNSTILIDTGGIFHKDIARESLIPFFKKKRIYNLDLLITTHDDFDHNGGVNSLIKNFRVKNYVTDSDCFPLSVGGIKLTNYNQYMTSSTEDNLNSLVIGFSLHHKNYLVMGDAPKEIEKKIIDDNPHLQCDILKVGHHGSNTSTSELFIKALMPKEAIISCGYKNRYGHPHKEVINILNKYKVKIRITDHEGTITYQNFIFT